MPTLDELYDEHGSHFIEEKDGEHSITFLYRAPDSSTNSEVTLDCPDLYEWILDDNGNSKKFTKDSDSNIYSLRIDNIPPEIFATYHIKVNDVVSQIPDPPNQRPLTLYRLELNADSVSMVQAGTPYLGEVVPDYLKHELPSTLKGSVTPGTFESKAKEERKTWVYKPEGFDTLPAEERKVIFMLDGKDFCEKLTPYIDAKGEPFSNTAIVFIDPANHVTPGPPGRVREDYFSTDEFAKLLREELIPQYCDKEKLDVINKDNVILAAHSLAAYPMITVAESRPDQIGGLFLFSPALNQNKQPNLPERPDPELQQLPIFMQIGQLEDVKPPHVHCESQDMQDKSRLQANVEFHQSLVEHGYSIETPVRVHPYGHDSQHVFEGMVQGMEFYQRRLEAKSDAQIRAMDEEKQDDVMVPNDGAIDPGQTLSTESQFAAHEKKPGSLVVARDIRQKYRSSIDDIKHAAANPSEATEGKTEDSSPSPLQTTPKFKPLG